MRESESYPEDRTEARLHPQYGLRIIKMFPALCRNELLWKYRAEKQSIRKGRVTKDALHYIVRHGNLFACITYTGEILQDGSYEVLA